MSQRKELTFEAIAIKENIGYASDYDSNGLFQVDMETGKCVFIRLFDDESVNTKRLHSSAIWINDKIYFIPLAGNNISIFRIKDNTIQSIQIPHPNIEKYTFYKKKLKFIRVVKNENYLWLVPSTYPGVLRMDLRTNDVKVFDNWVLDINYMFMNGLCVENESFLIPSGKSNIILIFDMNKETGYIERIGNNQGTIDMCKFKDTYWLAPTYEGPIISWNPLEKQVKKYSAYPLEFKAGRVIFSNIYSYKEEIIFLPANSNYALSFINGDLEIEKSQQWKQDSTNRLIYLFETDLYRYYREVNNEKVIRFYKISKFDNLLTTYSFFYFENGQRIKKWVEAMIKKNEEVRENDVLTLNRFMQEIL